MKLNDVEIEQAELVKQLEAQGFSVTIERNIKRATEGDFCVGVGYVVVTNSNTGCDDNPNDCDVKIYVGSSASQCGHTFADRTELNRIIKRLCTVRREKGWD